jgi:hypothetical protein
MVGRHAGVDGAANRPGRPVCATALRAAADHRERDHIVGIAMQIPTGVLRNCKREPKMLVALAFEMKTAAQVRMGWLCEGPREGVAAAYMLMVHGGAAMATLMLLGALVAAGFSDKYARVRVTGSYIALGAHTGEIMRRN